jgi:hypothetical protein
MKYFHRSAGLPFWILDFNGVLCFRNHLPKCSTSLKIRQWPNSKKKGHVTEEHDGCLFYFRKQMLCIIIYLVIFLFIITTLVLFCLGCLHSICKQDSSRQNVLLISSYVVRSSSHCPLNVPPFCSYNMLMCFGQGV